MDILDLDDDVQDLEELKEKRKAEPARRRNEKKDKRFHRISIIVLIIAVLVFIYAAWQLISIFLEYKKGEDEYQELEQYVAEEAPEPESIGITAGIEAEIDTGREEITQTLSRASFDELKAINSDIVAWLEFETVDINYPVVHTTDNEYYLTHTVKNTRNNSGAIFVETTNSPDFQDENTFVYGHSMKNGSMFGQLKKYKDESFYQEHQFFWIYTPQGDYMYQIFSCHEAEADSETYTNGFGSVDNYGEYLQKMKDLSLYETNVAVTTEDKIVTLSTCTKDKEVRFVVHAKRL